MYQNVIQNTKFLTCFIRIISLCRIKQAFFFFFPVHVEDIILHMFQYIQKLRTEGPQEWVFQECKVQ